MCCCLLSLRISSHFFSDFNIHQEKPYATDFISLLASFNLKWLVATGTHKSGNQLDLVYTCNCITDNILVKHLHVSDHFYKKDSGELILRRVVIHTTLLGPTPKNLIVCWAQINVHCYSISYRLLGYDWINEKVIHDVNNWVFLVELALASFLHYFHTFYKPFLPHFYQLSHTISTHPSTLAFFL